MNFYHDRCWSLESITNRKMTQTTCDHNLNTGSTNGLRLDIAVNKIFHNNQRNRQKNQFRYSISLRMALYDTDVGYAIVWSANCLMPTAR